VRTKIVVVKMLLVVYLSCLSDAGDCKGTVCARGSAVSLLGLQLGDLARGLSGHRGPAAVAAPCLQTSGSRSCFKFKFIAVCR
jgi:hypothetical protein